MNTKELLERLRRHYIPPQPLPGGVFLHEVGRNGGQGSSRRCDALYAGFTSTSGRILIGHEIKTSRADWRNELDHRGKADTWADDCHAWYVVAPSTEIVPPEELPPGWGLMVVNPRSKTRMTIKVKATVHHDRTPSWNAIRSLLARADTLRAQEIADTRRDALDKARRELREDQERARRTAAPALDLATQNRLEALDRVESQVGHEIGWAAGQVNANDFAAALKVARATATLGHFPRYETGALRSSAQRMLDALADLEAAHAEFSASSRQPEGDAS